MLGHLLGASRGHQGLVPRGAHPHLSLHLLGVAEGSVGVHPLQVGSHQVLSAVLVNHGVEIGTALPILCAAFSHARLLPVAFPTQLQLFAPQNRVLPLIQLLFRTLHQACCRCRNI